MASVTVRSKHSGTGTAGTGTIAVDLDMLLSEEKVLAARLDSDGVADGMLPDVMQQMQEQLRICRKSIAMVCAIQQEALPFNEPLEPCDTVVKELLLDIDSDSPDSQEKNAPQALGCAK